MICNNSNLFSLCSFVRVLWSVDIGLSGVTQVSAPRQWLRRQYVGSNPIIVMAIMVKCLAQGHKHHSGDRGSNPHSDDSAIRTQIQRTKPLSHATPHSPINRKVPSIIFCPCYIHSTSGENNPESKDFFFLNGLR